MNLTPCDNGTFLFPPSNYKNTTEYVDFWCSVPISDGVLGNITAGYADLVRRQLNAEKVPWGHRYDYQHSKDLTSGTEQQKDAARYRRSVDYEKFKIGWYKTYPEGIRAGAARSIARAGQMCHFASGWNADDAAVIRASTLRIHSEDLTVEGIVGRYQLDKIRAYFQDPRVTAAERLEDVRQELQRIQQQ